MINFILMRKNYSKPKKIWWKLGWKYIAHIFPYSAAIHVVIFNFLCSFSNYKRRIVIVQIIYFKFSQSSINFLLLRVNVVGLSVCLRIHRNLFSQIFMHRRSKLQHHPLDFSLPIGASFSTMVCNERTLFEGRHCTGKKNYSWLKMWMRRKL